MTIARCLIICVFSVDGQFAKSQDYFRAVLVKDTGSSEKRNLVEIIIQVLEMLSEDVDLQLSVGGASDYVMLYSLSAAHTVLNTLVDMTQVSPGLCWSFDIYFC